MSTTTKRILPLICCGLTLFFSSLVFSVEPFDAVGEEPAALPAQGADVALCYRGEVGFMLAPPEGWVNLRDTAEAFGLCVLFVPEGYDFDTAPAVIYPNVLEADGKGEPADSADAQAARMLEAMRVRPGGENVQLVRVESFQSAFGVEFQLRYFNNAPPPNNFELAAYHEQGGAMLIVVLSALSEQERRVYLSDFMNTLDAVFTMKVSGNDKAAEEASAAE